MIYRTSLKGSAIFSDDMKARYHLTRRGGYYDYLTVIGLNPSTADHETDDATIRKLQRIASRMHLGLSMVNLFAWRARDPRGLLDSKARAYDDENADALERICRPASLVVAAWGVQRGPKALATLVEERATAITHRLRRAGVVLCAFAETSDGHPRHPLYLRDDADLAPWTRSFLAPWTRKDLR